MYGQRIGVGRVSQAINISYCRSIRFISDNDRIGRYEGNTHRSGRYARRCRLHPDLIEPIVRIVIETFFAHLTVAESDITVVAIVGNVGKIDSFIKHFLIRIATNVVERGYGYEGILIGFIGHITYLERPRSSVLSVESEVELQCIERYAEARQYQVLRRRSTKLHCLGRYSVPCFGLYDTRTSSTGRYSTPIIGKRIGVYGIEVLF